MDNKKFFEEQEVQETQKKKEPEKVAVEQVQPEETNVAELLDNRQSLDLDFGDEPEV